MRHNMDVLAETYLANTATTLIGPKGQNQKTMADHPPAEVSDYACNMRRDAAAQVCIRAATGRVVLLGC
jgi:hypothetical protein